METFYRLNSGQGFEFLVGRITVLHLATAISKNDNREPRITHSFLEQLCKSQLMKTRTTALSSSSNPQNPLTNPDFFRILSKVFLNWRPSATKSWSRLIGVLSLRTVISVLMVVLAKYRRCCCCTFWIAVGAFPMVWPLFFPDIVQNQILTFDLLVFLYKILCAPTFFHFHNDSCLLFSYAMTTRCTISDANS
jgi:hypothetical protein